MFPPLLSAAFRRPPALALVLALALPLTACPDETRLDLSRQLGPVAVGTSLVTGLPEADTLTVLDLADGRPETIRHLPLDGPPSLIVAATPNSGDSSALVLSRQSRTLELIDVATGERRTLPLGSPFEGLAVSPDARFALAYYPPGTASSVFHNENEVAHIDLDPALTPEQAVTRRTLASLGGAPMIVALSPAVGDTRFALVLSEEHVAVLDLSAPDRPERSVPLVSLTSGGARTPTGVSFGVDGETLWAIVSTAEASSVYALAIARSSAAEAEPSGFTVRLSQLPGAGRNGAAALVPLTLPTGSALFTLTTNPSTALVTLTDVATATGKTLALSPNLDRLHLFEGDDGPMALLWSSTSGTTFHVIDLVAMAREQNKAFKTRSSRAPFTELVPIPGSPRFFAVHRSTDQGLSVLDADSDRVTGFGRTGQVRSLVMGDDHAYVLTTLGQETWLVSIDLESLHPEVAQVGHGAENLAVMADANTVAALSSEPGGLVTLWPLTDTSDAAALSVPGFLLDELFNR